MAAHPKFSAGDAPDRSSRTFTGLPGDPVAENLPVHQAGFLLPTNPTPHQPPQVGELGSHVLRRVWPENKQIFSRCCMSHGGSEWR